MPATVQLSTLTKEIGEHTEQLARPTEEMIAKGLNWLKDGGMLAPTNIREGGFVEEYFTALRDVPMCGLRTAFTKLKRGLYENINLDFIPTPATLAAMARIESRPVIDNLQRLKAKAATLEDLAKNPTKTTPEEMARIRQLHAIFKESHAASKVGERAGNIAAEQTVENAEYWQAISAFRDAPNITEEQKAFRRKIAATTSAKEPSHEHEHIDDSSADGQAYDQADEDYQMAS